MYLLSVFFPLLGGLINASPVARFLGHRGSSIVAIFCMVVAFLSSVVIYYEVVFMGCAVSIDVFGTWFSVGTFGASWTFNFDILTANMLFTVTGVSMAVHMYACDYMRQDPHLNLFLGYLSFFTGFMCVLVAADNLLVMLVGWEGNLTLCPNGDYLLCTVVMSNNYQVSSIVYSNNKHNSVKE
jgi:NADH:ubiquinone oxidoreductase subunit 5 (subunit L)/multisubunit Na+/H+ antiporter MnhA subunit